MNKRISALLVSIALTLPSLPARAIADATETTQLLNLGELTDIASSAAEQVSSLANILDNQITQTLTQIDIKLQQLKDITGYDKIMAAWTKGERLLSTASNLYNKAMTLAAYASDPGAAFDSLFPGFPTDGNYGSDANGLLSYSRAYRNWSDNSLGAVKASVVSANKQYNDLTQASKDLAKAAGKSDDADGTVKAIQASNNIAVLGVSELQNQSAAQAERWNAQAAWMAEQQMVQDSQTQAVQAFMTSGSTKIRSISGDGDFVGFNHSNLLPRKRGER